MQKTGAMMNGYQNRYQYDAFISYRHCEPDRTIAVRLQSMLETYRLPKSLAAQIGDRKLHFFRDEDELPTSANLSAGISEALEQSRYLICICSPAYLESRWCMQEIDRFKAMRGGSNANIIPLVVAGDDPTKSFPEQLLYETRMVQTPDGKMLAQEVPVEPLAGNVAAPAVRESLRKLRTEALRIAAPLFGVGFNDLFDRDRRRAAKRRRSILIGVFAAISLIAVYSSVMFLRIFRQNKQIEQQSLQLYENGTEMAMNAGMQVQAVEYAQKAVKAQLRINGESSADTERRLAKASGLYEAGSGIDFRTVVSVTGGVFRSNTFYNTDGSALIVTAGPVTRVLDAVDGTERFSVPWYTLSIPEARFAGKNCFFVIEGMEEDAPDELRVVAFDLLSGEERWTYPLDLQALAESDPRLRGLLPDDAYLTGHDDAGMLALVLYLVDDEKLLSCTVFLDAQTGEEVSGLERQIASDPAGRMAMTADGTLRAQKTEGKPEEDVIARHSDDRYARLVSGTQIELHSRGPSLNMRLMHGDEALLTPQDISEAGVVWDDQTYAYRDKRFACIGRLPAADDQETVRSVEVSVYDTHRETLLAAIEADCGNGALMPQGILFTDDDHLLLYGWEGSDNAFCNLYRTDGGLCDSVVFPVESNEDLAKAGFDFDDAVYGEGFLQAGRDASVLVLTRHAVSVRNERITVTTFDDFAVTEATVNGEGAWAACVVFRDGDGGLVAGEGHDWNGYTTVKKAGERQAVFHVPVLSPDGTLVACTDWKGEAILIGSSDGTGRVRSIAVEAAGVPDFMLFADAERLFAIWGSGDIRVLDTQSGLPVAAKDQWNDPVGTSFSLILRMQEDRIVVFCDGYGLLLDAGTLEVCAEFPYFLCPAEGGKKIISRVESVNGEEAAGDSACCYIGDVLDTEGLLSLSQAFLDTVTDGKKR